MELTFAELLKELKKRKIEISVKEGKLSYSGPSENIDPDILDNLRFHKSKMISHLLDPRTSNLMPIQPEGNRVPLFLVHAQEANYDVSGLLGNDQPIYGFFHIGSDGKKVDLKSVEDLASIYVEQMKAYYNGDDFYLIGYSFGGALAYEIAVQLQAEGKIVKYLAMVDVTAPVYKTRSIFAIHKNFLKAIKREIFDVGKNWLRDRFKLLYCKITFIRNKSIPVRDRPFYIVNRYLKIHKKYKPRSFDGEIYLIKTDQGVHRIENYGWSKLVNNVHESVVVGSHYGIFRNEEIPDLLVREFLKSRI